MNRQESAALDRHITGNYGEDQFREYPDDFEPTQCQVSGCDETAVDGILCDTHLDEQGEAAIEEQETCCSVGACENHYYDAWEE